MSATPDQAANQGAAGIEIEAACLTSGGHLKRLAPSSVAETIRSAQHTTWVHVRVHDKQAAQAYLLDELKFHPLSVEDAVSDRERPTMQEFDGVTFLAAYAIEDVGYGEEFVEVAFFLLPHALVTVASKPAPNFENWFSRWCDRAQSFGRQPAFLLHAVLDALVDDYFPLTDRLDEQVEALGDQVYAGSSFELGEAIALKRRFLEVRRHITPTRDVVNSLLRRDIKAIPPEARPYFQDVYDHTLRVTEIVDVNREQLASIMDAYLASVSNNLGLVMRKLTVYATMLMSMGLVAGVYGMNFDFMPELHWLLGYPFALALMLLVAVVQYRLFKSRHWL